MEGRCVLSSGGMILAGKTTISEENVPHKSDRDRPAIEPGSRSDRPATNCLCRGMTFNENYFKFCLVLLRQALQSSLWVS